METPEEMARTDSSKTKAAMPLQAGFAAGAIVGLGGGSGATQNLGMLTDWETKGTVTVGICSKGGESAYNSGNEGAWETPGRRSKSEAEARARQARRAGTRMLQRLESGKTASLGNPPSDEDRKGNRF
jgi:hypothetical protein